jgi:hypothetical protein
MHIGSKLSDVLVNGAKEKTNAISFVCFQRVLRPGFVFAESPLVGSMVTSVKCLIDLISERPFTSTYHAS